MESALKIADAIMQIPERDRRGTLRMFGDWFGRPMDNVHRVTDARADGERLILIFDNAETLTVWSPGRYSTIGDTIRIADADRVRWEWYHYERDHTPENLLFHDYRKIGGKIVVSRTQGSDNPGASVDEPAVELIGMW